MVDDEANKKLPWITIRDLPALILLLPFGLVLGFHLSLVGYGLCRITRIPYLVALVTLFAISWIPSAFLVANFGNPWYAAASVTLFVTVIGIHLLFCSREDLRTGCNMEYTAMPHLTLVLPYLMLHLFK